VALRHLRGTWACEPGGDELLLAPLLLLVAEAGCATAEVGQGCAVEVGSRARVGLSLDEDSPLSRPTKSVHAVVGSRALVCSAVNKQIDRGKASTESSVDYRHPPSCVSPVLVCPRIQESRSPALNCQRLFLCTLCTTAPRSDISGLRTLFQPVRFQSAAALPDNCWRRGARRRQPTPGLL
jgi:hypothetical protein